MSGRRLTAVVRGAALFLALAVGASGCLVQPAESEPTDQEDGVGEAQDELAAGVVNPDDLAGEDRDGRDVDDGDDRGDPTPEPWNVKTLKAPAGPTAGPSGNNGTK